MKQKVDILLMYEGKERELESVCLLETELKRRGYKTKIECVYPNKEWLPIRYRASVVFTPWAYNNRDMKFLSCFYINKNTKIINFHHEQYSGADGNNILIPLGRSKEVYHISWGPCFTRDLINAGCDREKICEPGNIRLDFFKPQFKKCVISKETLAKEFNIDASKKWVLFIANGYHLANEIKLENMSTIDKYAKEKAKVCTEIRTDFLNYVDMYLENNDEAIFIYRPHPVLAELDIMTKEIQHLLNKHEGRFFCVFKYAIREWIANCSLSISIHSTAGVESYAASKAFYLFRTKDFSKELDYSFYLKYRNIIRDYSGFESAIKEQRVVETWDAILKYYKIDGNEFAYEYICDFVDKIIHLKGDGKFLLGDLVNTYLRGLYKDFLVRGLKIKTIRKWIEKKAEMDSRYNTIFPSFHDVSKPEEIQQIERSIQACVRKEIKG